MPKLVEEIKLCVMLNKNNLSHYSIIIFYYDKVFIMDCILKGLNYQSFISHQFN